MGGTENPEPKIVENYCVLYGFRDAMCKNLGRDMTEGGWVVLDTCGTISYYLQYKTDIVATPPQRNAHLCSETAHRLDDTPFFAFKTLQPKPWNLTP